MKTKIVVFFSLFFIFINLLSINAQPPFQDLSVTLKIESNYNDYHKVNEPLLIHVHVYDSVTGIAYPAGDVNMTIHLYSHDLGGELIYETQAINNTYWTTETIIDGSYFNETGQYSISINAFNGIRIPCLIWIYLSVKDHTVVSMRFGPSSVLKTIVVFDLNSLPKRTAPCSLFENWIVLSVSAGIILNLSTSSFSINVPVIRQSN